MRRFLTRVLVLALLGGIAAFAWRRWRGPWPIQPQPEWTTPASPVAATTPSTPAEPSPVTQGAPVTPAGDEPAVEWVAPVAGQCPEGYPVKANRSGIFHVPGGRFYERTSPERCYSSAEAAERDGYRPSKT